MTRYFTNNFSVTNLHKKPSVKSEIVTQMIYGDSFSISKKSKKWLKIKIKEVKLNTILKLFFIKTPSIKIVKIDKDKKISGSSMFKLFIICYLGLVQVDSYQLDR